MNSEQITAFLQAHWEWVTLIMGIVSVAGSILNWNWMCDPTGKPDSHRYGRGSRRVIFFLYAGCPPPQQRIPACGVLPAGCPPDRGEHLGICAKVEIGGAIP